MVPRSALPEVEVVADVETPGQEACEAADERPRREDKVPVRGVAPALRHIDTVLMLIDLQVCRCDEKMITKF